MKTNRFLLEAALLAAAALALSCSGDGGGDPQQPSGGGGSSSSSGGPASSSSGGAASAQCGGVGYDPGIYRCDMGELVGKCRGVDYYAAYEQCTADGVVVDREKSSSSFGESGGGSSSSEGESSSGMGEASSSSEGASSSSSACTAADNTETQYCSDGAMRTYGSVTDGGGNTYKTVVIGEQTWMAKNLNYNVAGSKCYNNSLANCEKYGRLYYWTTALNVCPNGWNLPTNEEWDALYRYADGTSGTSSPYNSLTAGKHLKATSGWNSYSGIVNLDTYGFAALPGSLGHSDGLFGRAGTEGWWWSASENASSGAYSRLMYYNYENASCIANNESYMYSVRCVKD